MKKVIAYGITLVLAQTMAGLLLSKYMLSRMLNKDFMKKYTKMTLEVTKELSEENFI